MVLVGALLGALAAWIGTILAHMLCRDIVPYDDGPEPVDYAVWHFPAAGAIIGSLAGLHAWQLAEASAAMLIVVALAACAACDLRCGMLPDSGAFAVLAVAIVLAAGRNDWMPGLNAAAMALPFAILAFLTRGRGMGWGDVKLAAAGGAVLGISGAMLAFALAAIVALVIARSREALRRPIPFGAYLAGSIALSFALIR